MRRPAAVRAFIDQPRDLPIRSHNFIEIHGIVILDLLDSEVAMPQPSPTPSSPEKPNAMKREFFAINGLRFIAAFWVLIFHASVHLGELAFLAWFQPIIDQGVLAMTLFFVLSGFILSYRYTNFSSTELVEAYAAARIARLYPVYAFMGLVTIWKLRRAGSGFWLPSEYGTAGQVAFLAVVGSLFVFGLQAWFPGLFRVWNFGGSWSLSVEAFFYSLFPHLRPVLAERSDRELRVVTYSMPILMALIAIGLLASHRVEFDTSLIFYELPIFRLPEFVFGICGYLLFVERKLDRGLLAGLATVSAVLLVCGVYYANAPGFIEWGGVAAVAFMGSFVWCLKLDAPPLVKAVVNYSGRISYCVYMAQFAVLPVVKHFRAKYGMEEAWALAILGTAMIAVITYHFVEVPAYGPMYRIARDAARVVGEFLAGDRKHESV
jgi:peptidoglycan/LPS O-acetylase OafA/YrhL